MTPPKSHRTARGFLQGSYSWRCDGLYLVPAAVGPYLTLSIGDGSAIGHRSSLLRLRNTEMSEAAVLPRGNAVAHSNEARGEAHMGQTGRSDGRNRRAAETRRKIIAAAKEMIAETSTAPTVVAVAKRADVSVRSVFQHFGDVESLFVTVVDSVRGDLVVPPPTPTNRPLPNRIASVVDNLAHAFDRIVPLRVAAGQFANHPALIERGLTSKNELRQATFEVFAPEFALLSEA